ncbi:alpha/beta hydrolase [Spirosoma endbachense]|uniref:Carbohydrate esterase n=1 Tax=Spirosoma endbachense TaxID=2666025 RepID=A0A6P1VQL6_9BACT|nr:alpha/beta hydrolase-fold protein [Spirosoma endbachense]QHV93879.1 carbohydrate esterase [Spirosoma endbachense]
MPPPLRFELTTPVQDDRPVYLSGNFCDWYPDIDAFRMWPMESGGYALDFPTGVPLPEVLEYKYTRGGWDQAELDMAGDVPPNRISRRKTGTRRDYVPHWRWFGRSFNPDFLPKLGLLAPDFTIPQLGTTRRVRVLVPHDYDQSDKRYPVLYLNDGQNLIGAGSEYGSWEIDRRLAVLASRHHHELIVVAIDHGGVNRVREFTPEMTMAGTGDGRNYLDFLVRTLKPYIDSIFRSLPDAVNTGIGGSSLGGLISLYGGLLHPATFGRLLVFSPSLWISKNVLSEAARFRVEEPTKVYAFGGAKESKFMVQSLKQLIDALDHSPGRNRIETQLLIDPKGQHSESYWGHEFPKAVEWLFYGTIP